MRKIRQGFTLVELLVVVLIIAILAIYGAPNYLKSVETGKATDALGMVTMIANANRMYNSDNPGNWASGAMATANILVQNKYVPNHNWGAAPYTYTAIAGGASAVRKSGRYAGWGYSVTNGACSVLTADTPPCGRF